MYREGDGVVLDFTGTDPQSPGSINYYLNENLYKMFFGIYMIMVFDPQILWNDGYYPLVDVRIPQGTLLKPTYPAALSCRTHALGRIFDILGGLLGQRQPDFLCAAGFSSSPHLMYSGNREDTGEWYQLYQIGFGGIPGRPFGDGPDGHSLWPSFTNVPNEFLEAYFPLVIENYETVADSGGPGFFRGGNGVDIGYRFLEEGSISIHDDRWFVPPWGVNGGLPGARSRKWLERADGSTTVLPSKCDNVHVVRGDLLHYVTWGGGGWGDPYDREPELVALEVKRGLVTREGAQRYGVVLADDGAIDVDATDTLRTRLREERGETQVFVRGPSIDELRASCLADTGLEPPQAPTFRTRKAPEPAGA
jgi:N-methylhydantoinase B